MLAVLAGGCAGGSSSEKVGEGTAGQVHLGWAGDPRTSVVVHWHTATAAGHGVRFRAEEGPWRAAYGRPPAVRPVGPGFWHETELTGLAPDTAYEYAVEGDGGLSQAYPFRTAPEGPSAFRFAAFADQGDCQTHPGACGVQERIAADRPALVLAAGDLTYANSGGPAAADRWFDDVMAFAASSPVMPAWGNHEWAEGDPIENYKGRFALPEAHGEDWYSFDYAGVHFVALPERYVDIDEDSRFRDWIEGDLERASADLATNWLVAFTHRPFFTTGSKHGPTKRGVRHLVPLLERYGVDLVIAGHEHSYERTLPMRGGAATSTDPARSVRGQGTVYVVTGGGGAELSGFEAEQPWSAKRLSVHQHLRVDASAEALRLEAVTTEGEVVDRFEIGAGAPGAESEEP